ncbi:endo alpha-1,4 polygalactosaminidase [Butyrivibrio sp. VCD2006]|uniref:endo alpha-1,4 polygalactosaminidase n=1 Tax=Butyrivibrio sp. VCD2006 TaxID=1280664 RepID=UPI000403F74C|nr:endo alpha-1,4 polygalactosaminidase [Butyrivibrio sp. VCD2006]
MWDTVKQQLRREIAVFLISLFTSILLFPSMAHAGHVVDIESPDGPRGYGVYIGANAAQLHKKLDKDTDIGLAIIDAQYVTAQDIGALKSNGRRIYTYLNVGSLEEFRDYYDTYSALTLNAYENWPGEYWIDVSEEPWQDFICDTVARDCVAKGVDGFFIDNCDVYYLYQHSWIYKGLVKIITRLRDSYNLPIIVNGGDMFVTQLMDEGKQGLITGINQESVFSSILDYDKGIFGEQPALDREYFVEYLKRAKKQGLIVYMLEYTRDMRLVEKISDFCIQNGYKCYVTDSLRLDGNVEVPEESGTDEDEES